MRKTIFIEGEFYHVYNRGVDKRTIFLDDYDYARFLQSMDEFNTVNPIGSIYENFFAKKLGLGHRVSKNKKLVNITAYCLNPNHFHFILSQVSNKGIEKFMQRLSMGYAKYFNHKYKRNGVLFQGKFKAVHVDTNEYLLHLSAYINLNNRVHKLKKLPFRSSWVEYTGREKYKRCKKNIILDQFKNSREYKEFAEDALVNILARKSLLKELESLLLE